ncbi:hypothetical protein JADG_003354 [Aureobasidium aubasidani]|nr:hypothetical protein JADG_003354 [Aureobasidium pullulans]
MKPRFRGWAEGNIMGELNGALLYVVAQPQSYSEAIDYDLNDWSFAVRSATSEGRVVKQIFDAVLAQTVKRTYRWMASGTAEDHRVENTTAAANPPAEPRFQSIEHSAPIRTLPFRSARRDRLSTNLRSKSNRRAIFSRSRSPKPQQLGAPPRQHDSNAYWTHGRTPGLTHGRYGQTAAHRLEDSPFPRRGRSPSISRPPPLGRNSHRNVAATRYERRAVPGSGGRINSALENNTLARNNHRHPAGIGHEATGRQLDTPPRPMHHHTTLSAVELQEVKNQSSFSCVDEGKVCAYICCPLNVCSLEVECPAYHMFPGLDQEPDEKVGSPMHLLALLNLNRGFVHAKELRQIQAIHDDSASAQHIYMLLQKEVERAIQRERKFDDLVAKKLLRDSEQVARMGNRALSFGAEMIVKLVHQMKKQPYLELWEHDHRTRKFGPPSRT